MMWIGTNSGLKSFDGYKINTYRSTVTSPGILPNNSVMSITEGLHDHLWIGTRNGLVRMNRRKGSFKTFRFGHENQRIIYTLFTSRNGTIWIGTDGGLTRYMPQENRFYTYKSGYACMIDIHGKRKQMPNYSVKSIVEDKSGNLYIGTWSSGLYRFQPKTGIFFQYPKLNALNSAYTLFMDHRYRLWIGTWGYGIICLEHPYKQQQSYYLRFNQGRSDFNTFYKIIEDPVSHTIWAASREGVSVLSSNHIKSGFINYTGVETSHLNVSFRFCNDIIGDGDGNIWIETLNEGIKHINTRPSPFRYFYLDHERIGLSINSVCSLFSDDGHWFWLGLRPFGIVLYNRYTGQFKYNENIPILKSIPKIVLSASFPSIVRRFNGELWMANASFGVIVIHPGKEARLLNHDNMPCLGDNYVNILYSSRNGIMWVGQRSCLSCIFPNNKGIQLHMIDGKRDFSNCDVRGITEDRFGHIWIATDNEGIIRIEGNPQFPNQLRFRHYCPENHNFIVNDAITCFADSHHRLWAISNSGGLFLYDVEKDSFIPVNSLYHIAGESIFSVNEDSWGNLWIATDEGLSRLSFRKNIVPQVTSFSQDDGLDNLFFEPNSTFKLGKELFFGSSAGFFSFIPNSRMKSPYGNANLVITDLLIDGVPYNQLPSYLKSKISHEMPSSTRCIKIPASVNKFGIEFSLLSHGNSKQTKYAYILEGYDKKWHYSDASQRLATFENLPVGTYKLQIKAINNYGEWKSLPYPLTIMIQPAFYATTWAYLFYGIFLVGLVFLFIRFYRRHIEMKNRLQTATILTNITHELITPLAVISAAIDEWRIKSSGNDEDYILIQNNINRLSRLLRQILEIRKSDEGQLKLHVSQADLAEFVRIDCENIRPMAAMRRLTFDVDCGTAPIIAWFDADKLDKILYNLLSNAIKFSRERGHVSILLRREGNQTVLMVKDNGSGISRDQMKSLYKRFRIGRSKARILGSGVGLSLTYDLVILHHGTISCKSEVDKGTVFKVKIPITKESYHADEISIINSSVESSIIESPRGKKGMLHPEMPEIESDYKVLIVEDNEELLGLMQRFLSHRYQILTASEGKQALEYIKKEDIDLVVSDVMMPGIDGFELTRRIKNSEDYAQLPVILLTVKNQDDDWKTAYETGADAYITKPFQLDDLQLRIANILENRMRVQKKFSSQTTFEVSKQHYSSPDEVFIQKAIDCVKSHLSDSDYDREQFASDMCVSSSTLYNKLRALTGQNITGFINSIRLKEACKIARNNPTIRVGELSEKVGFNTPKYFTKCFKKEFGMLLREYIEQETHVGGSGPHE